MASLLANPPLAYQPNHRGLRGAGPSFSLKTGKLAIRVACLHVECGLADKDGAKNIYSYSDDVENTAIEFHCPEHGPCKLNLSHPQRIQMLEFSTHLRNIVRAKVFARDPDVSWIRVPGTDYAGYFWWYITSEKALLIFYSPLIVILCSYQVINRAFANLFEDCIPNLIRQSCQIATGSNVQATTVALPEEEGGTAVKVPYHGSFTSTPNFRATNKPNVSPFISAVPKRTRFLFAAPD